MKPSTVRRATDGQPSGHKTPRKRLLFALAAMTLSALSAVVAIVLTDLYLHSKYERRAGLNRWGYAGPVIGRKEPREIRIAVLGGSTAFGYGPGWTGSFPYLLEQRLKQQAADGRRYSVINLAYNNEGAYAFLPTLEDFRYTQFDIAALYEGYNDLGDAPNTRVYRRDSGVFRLTGYLPIFPMVFREKAAVLLYGNTELAYRSQTVFNASLADRATAAALHAAAATAESLNRQLGRLTRDVRNVNLTTPNAGCQQRWRHYCDAVFDAVTWARERGIGVLVGTQPYVSDRHIEQQNALVNMLHARFHHDPGVVHVNLGNAVDLRDPRLAYDGMHLNEAGNAVIAQHLIEPVQRMVKLLEASAASEAQGARQ